MDDQELPETPQQQDEDDELSVEQEAEIRKPKIMKMMTGETIVANIFGTQIAGQDAYVFIMPCLLVTNPQNGTYGLYKWLYASVEKQFIVNPKNVITIATCDGPLSKFFFEVAPRMYPSKEVQVQQDEDPNGSIKITKVESDADFDNLASEITHDDWKKFKQ